MPTNAREFRPKALPNVSAGMFFNIQQGLVKDMIFVTSLLEASAAISNPLAN